MSTGALPYPMFDADNHLYETQDAFTRYLPKEYASAIQYVQINGRTKIAIRGQISEYIPNPTFEAVARPGARARGGRHPGPRGPGSRVPRLALVRDAGIRPVLEAGHRARGADRDALLRQRLRPVRTGLGGFHYGDAAVRGGRLPDGEPV